MNIFMKFLSIIMITLGFALILVVPVSLITDYLGYHINSRDLIGITLIISSYQTALKFFNLSIDDIMKNKGGEI